MQTTIKKIQSIKDTVMYWLEKDEATRDSDSRLVCLIWWNQGKNANLDMERLPAMNFMKLLLEPNSPFTSSDVITRARRLIQANYPHTRGIKYQERHNEEKKVRENINKL